MSKTGDHAEDVEHELEHAGREVGEKFADSIDEPDEAEQASMQDEEDES